MHFTMFCYPVDFVETVEIPQIGAMNSIASVSVFCP